ncbi:hypothetical protein PHLGIDRAFT_122862 [Phlebiopsis gigantea 11061_1 CR5-6]|uniref:DUF6532 domain-containing protein n=1 Tax=Phlebiopsis gigantea (strain 11061_1 CR5-6) TaxID=745531 RepID=A0A0C3PAW3_PHLG1|nr:hypothetical protein PHLGIDRAFT_122862 [Phlebiopsis gigantea 11061_1 CR5-6]
MVEDNVRQRRIAKPSNRQRNIAPKPDEEREERRRRLEKQKEKQPSRKEKTIARKVQVATAGVISSRPVPLVQKTTRHQLSSLLDLNAADRAYHKHRTKILPVNRAKSEFLQRIVQSSLALMKNFLLVNILRHRDLTRFTFTAKVDGPSAYNREDGEEYPNQDPGEEGAEEEVDGDDEQPLPPRSNRFYNSQDELEDDGEPLTRLSHASKRKRTPEADYDESEVLADGADIDDEVDELGGAEGHTPKLRKVDTDAKGRACLKHFATTAQDFIATAQSIYEIFLICRSAFPTHHEQDTWAREAWDLTCEREGQRFHLTTEIVRMITRRGTHLRNEWKKAARSVVKTAYCLKSGDPGPAAKKKNLRLVNLLLLENPSGFTFPKAELKKPEDERKDMYKHHAFSDLLHEACFRSPLDLGVAYEDIFDEHIGLKTFAFLCTMLEYAISEFQTGVWKNQIFYEHVNKKIFDKHMKNLLRFEKTFAQVNLLTKMGQKLLLNVRRRANAGSLDAVDNDVLPQAMFDAMLSNWEKGDTSTDTDYYEPQESDEDQ